MPNLLIHSLAEFRELIFAALDVVAPAHVVEVGSESGSFTELLVDWSMAHGARLTTIDPAPADRVRTLAARAPGVQRLVLDRTPAALEGLEAAQVYLLDGDHNHWTVTHELRHIHASTQAAGVAPLVFLHDVGWPWARRDLYYDPTVLPPEHVHPHTFTKGLHIDVPEPFDGGFRSHGAYAFALHEGGSDNGVLTAIEGFLAATPGYELHVVPAVFGLGVLFPTAHPKRAELIDLLRGHEKSPLLARLEENRLRNYLQVIALQDREGTIVAERDAIAHERAAVIADRDALRGRVADLERRLDAAEARVRELESRWYARAAAKIEKTIKRPSS